MDMDKLAAVRQRVALLKIPALLDALPAYLDSVDGGIVIYCYHRAVLTALMERIQAAHPDVRMAEVHGGVGMTERDQIIRAFQAGSIKIICATIGALREGVNLTEGEMLIFMEYDWTPANMEQAIGRLHRRGQDRTVHVHFFAFTDGIDRYIDRVLKRKKSDIKKIMQ